MAEDKRLAASLFVALVLHLLAFGLLGPPRKSVPPVARPLVVQWVKWASAPPNGLSMEPDLAVERGASGQRPNAVSSRDRRTRPAPLPSAASRPAGDTQPATSDLVERQPPAAAELMESARTIVREMARDHMPRQSSNAMKEDRPFMPALDRALRNAEAGEERLAGGLIRITTKSGRIYCLKPPPDMARDGPVAMQSTPTNCP